MKINIDEILTRPAAEMTALEFEALGAELLACYRVCGDPMDREEGKRANDRALAIEIAIGDAPWEFEVDTDKAIPSK